MEVLIIGAGPTGLTAAVELARLGIIPEVVERRKEPSGLSRAVGILPRSLELLKPSGAGTRIYKEGIRIKRIHMHRGEKVLATLDFSTSPKSVRAVAMPQDQTETILRETFEKFGGNVSYSTEVKKVKTTKEQATVTFIKGKQKTYDWVIGADGIDSITRKSMRIPFEGYELRETWSIADIKIAPGFKKDIFHAWLGDDIVVAAPIGENRFRIVSSTPDSLKVLPLPVEVTKIRRAGKFKITVRQAKRYLKGRVLLAGDAAHAHSPVGGRGMNLGIEDAVEAAKAIVNGTVEQYAEERYKVGAEVIKKTEWMRKVVSSDKKRTQLLTNFVLRTISKISFLKKLFIKVFTKL